MKQQLKTLTSNVSQALSGATTGVIKGLGSSFKPLAILGLVGYLGYQVVQHPPVKEVPIGMVGVRTSAFDSQAEVFTFGSVVMVPGIHSMRLLDVRDRTYQPEDMRYVDSAAPLQSIEGLSIGLDLNVRYGLDVKQLNTIASKLPENIDYEIVEPAIHGIIYQLVAGYTVKEAFSTKRLEIQQKLTQALRKKLAKDGIILKSVQIGKVDLPEHYKRGMEAKLAEELAAEKMAYTLELKQKEIEQTRLIAQADKAKRQTIAEARALEQVIAAKAKEDAMKHILPYKERLIKQKELEAEATKKSAIKAAEGRAKARTIEAMGEAQSRRKLADAEAYRLELVGKVNAEQMEREGMVITKHPLLIQKAMADKLSDQIKVIVAPPATDGGLITANLLGKQSR